MKTLIIDGIEYKVTTLKSQITNNPKSLYGIKARGSKRRNCHYSEKHLLK